MKGSKQPADEMGRQTEKETPTALAVIRIRGSAGVPGEIRDTLDMLRLNRVNHCVIVPKAPASGGMLRKARDYLTWGEIQPETLEMLISKRGRLQGNSRIDRKDAKSLAKGIMEGKKEGLKIKPVFRLSPPGRGFRSLRGPFPRGDLGYRGGRINELLERMI